MPPNIPMRSHFPSNLTLDIILPPSGHPPTNVLILLHGLGDTQASFATLGRSLSLPETVCLSIRGPAPLPFDIQGYHWGDDIVFDQSTGDMDIDTGFGKSTKLLLEDVIRGTLLTKCGYWPRDVLLLGFGQGGMVALEAASKFDGELGGIVSIGGALPVGERVSEAQDRKIKTPVLLCKGRERSAIEDEHKDRLKEKFNFLEIKEWNRGGDSMPRNRDEMLPIMAFFARRLRSVRGIPQGSVELN